MPEHDSRTDPPRRRRNCDESVLPWPSYPRRPARGTQGTDGGCRPFGCGGTPDLDAESARPRAGLSLGSSRSWPRRRSCSATRSADGLAGLTTPHPIWLWVAALLFRALARRLRPAWRASLRSWAADRRHRRVGALRARLLVNSLAPAKIGTALAGRALLARAAGEGRLWTAGGICTVDRRRADVLADDPRRHRRGGRASCLPGRSSCSAARSSQPASRLGRPAFAAGRDASRTCSTSSAPSARCPRTPPRCSAGRALRRRPHRRRRRPRRGLRARPKPLAIAFLIVPAVELASPLPLTPANIGVAAAAVASRCARRASRATSPSRPASRSTPSRRSRR